MQDLEKLRRELERSGRTEQLKTLAQSEEGRRLRSMVDAEAVAGALRNGDGAALQQQLSALLSTGEGQRLAERLKKLMER